MKTKQLGFINWAKAIAIIGVIVGHFLPDGGDVKAILYSFHVPFFFVIAGFLFKDGAKKPRLLPYLKNRVTRLLIPYTIYIALSYIFERSAQPRPVWSAFLCWTGRTTWNAALWFFPVMLEASILFYFLIRRKGSSVIPVSVMTLISFGGTIVLQQSNVFYDYFGFAKTLHMLGYMGVGYLIGQLIKHTPGKHSSPKKPVNKLLVSLISLVGFSLFCLLVLRFNAAENISVLKLSYNNIYLYIPLAILGSVSFLFCFYALPTNIVIDTLAHNTVFLFATHYFFLDPWRDVVGKNNLMPMLEGALYCCLILFAFLFLYRLLIEHFLKGKGGKLLEPFGLFAK